MSDQSSMPGDPDPKTARVGPPNVRAGKLRERLEQISRDGDGWSKHLAVAALREDDRLRDQERGGSSA